MVATQSPKHLPGPIIAASNLAEESEELSIFRFLPLNPVGRKLLHLRSMHEIGPCTKSSWFLVIQVLVCIWSLTLPWCATKANVSGMEYHRQCLKALWPIHILFDLGWDDVFKQDDDS